MGGCSVILTGRRICEEFVPAWSAKTAKEDLGAVHGGTAKYVRWIVPNRHEGIDHMRKVAAGLFSSIDGVVEAPTECQPGVDEEIGAALQRMLDEQDAVLLGRVTFTEFAEYWPTSTDEPFASWINSIQKYVASTTLDTVDQWRNSTLIKGRWPTSSRSCASRTTGSISRS